MTSLRRSWGRRLAPSGPPWAGTLPVIIPCHRVVGADGSLTGYAGGLDRKKLLLKLETGPTDQF